MRFAARLILDVLLWGMTVLYALGGITIRGQVKFTYVHDFWVAIGGLYLVFRPLLGVRFRDTSYGKAWIAMADGFLRSCRARTLTPLRELRWQSLLLLALAFYLCALFIALPVLTYWSFGNFMFDLGIFVNATYNAATTGKFFTAVLTKPSGAILYVPENHLNLGLVFFAAIFKAFPHPEIMLIGQSLALLLALIPLYKLGDRILPPAIPRWAPLLLYFFWDPIHRMNTWDFHEPPFMIPFCFWGLYFIETRRMGRALVSMLLMAIWKEDAWWIFAGMSVYAAIRMRRIWPWVPIALLGFSVLPIHAAYFNKVNSIGERYPYLGNSFKEAIYTAMTRPWVFWPVMVQNAEFYWRLVLNSGGAVFLLGGVALIPLVPPLAIVGLAQHAGMPNWLNHYVGAFAAPLFFATLYGWAWLYPRLDRRWGEGVARALLGCSLAICLTQLSFNEPGALGKVRGRYEWSRCFVELEKAVPANAPLLTVDPFSARMSLRNWVALTDPAVDQTWAEWFLHFDKKLLPTVGMKGARPVGPWVIVQEKCGYYLAKRGPL